MGIFHASGMTDGKREEFQATLDVAMFTRLHEAGHLSVELTESCPCCPTFLDYRRTSAHTPHASTPTR